MENLLSSRLAVRSKVTYWASNIWEFSPYEQTRLDYIANLCPFIGGEATYLSRGLIHLYNDEIVYDDENVCSTTYYAYRLANPDQSSYLLNQGKRSRVINSKISTFKIYPNPSIDYLVIEYPMYSINKLLLKDINGRIVLEKYIDLSVQKSILNISALAPAEYLIMLIDKSGGIMYQDKIAIIK